MKSLDAAVNIPHQQTSNREKINRNHGSKKMLEKKARKSA
jgi:hypothetical protein